jgi:hypothetical protein
MELAADAVVFLTGLPIAGALIVDGAQLGRMSEIAAGLCLAAILGVPSLLCTLSARLRRH